MTGPLADLDSGLLVTFLCGSVVAVWSAVVLSGFLPRRMAHATAGPLGAALTYSATALTLALIGVLAMTVSLLPTAVAVIAAGLAILGTPFLVDPIPNHIRESYLALAATVSLPIIALAVLPWPL